MIPTKSCPPTLRKYPPTPFSDSAFTIARAPEHRPAPRRCARASLLRYRWAAHRRQRSRARRSRGWALALLVDGTRAPRRARHGRAGTPGIEEHAMQLRRPRELDVSFLAQLARERVAYRLADFHPAARQVPAADIAVLDEKDAAAARRSPARARQASCRGQSANKCAGRAASARAPAQRGRTAVARFACAPVLFPCARAVWPFLLEYF